VVDYWPTVLRVYESYDVLDGRHRVPIPRKTHFARASPREPSQRPTWP
jgi:hypothetical protein